MKVNEEQLTEPEAAVAILRAAGPPESVLLIRRAEREGDSWSGHWSFPGGRREPEDADPLETALRELEEECGIRLSRDRMESALPLALARRKVGRFVLVAPFVFPVESELPTVLDQREAVDALWVPLSVLRDPAYHFFRSAPGRPREMLFPVIELRHMPLWGFTYRLISDWLELIPQQHAAFDFASQLLDFLLSNGLTLRHGWQERTAALEGVIPVELVLAKLSGQQLFFPPVNLVEVQPDSIRLIGLAYEEYLIRVDSD